jgi:isopenicillin N synthase-like dioxygenase
MDEQPPVIDISGLIAGAPGARERATQSLGTACSEWGAFHVVGHAVPRDDLDRFTAAIREFFALPSAARRALRRSRDNARGWYDEELTKNRPDWKEVFDYGAERDLADPDAQHSDGINQWPAGRDALRATLLGHYSACEQLALTLLRAICASLGAPPEALDSAFTPHSSFVRLNRYPPCSNPAPLDAPLFPEQGEIGVHHHTDAGALTVLHQDEVAGLQIEHRGRFVLIEPVEGAFAVNLADMLQVWSNDRYRSPLHRVIPSAERSRYSAPFFLNPGYSAVAEPLPELLGAGEPARYRSISWAHFRDQRSAGDYANYGSEIQIADYRIHPARIDPARE